MLRMVRQAVGGVSEEEGLVSGTDANESMDFSASSTSLPPRPPVGMVVDMADTNWSGGLLPVIETPRFPYTRPEFLYFTEDEIAASSDQSTRPVLVPKQPDRMPIYAGYAECVSAGKTESNEDQATARVMHLVQTGFKHENNSAAPSPFVGRKDTSKRLRASSECRQAETERGDERRHSGDEHMLTAGKTRNYSSEDGPATPRCEAVYFGIFDGHAGTGAAVVSANCLHEHIRERLCQVLETVLHLDRQEQLLGYCSGSPTVCSPNGKILTRDSLVIGAMETAFVEMDDQISEEKMLWRIPGGCAVCVALIFLGKVYVANAGDCRALLCCNDRCQPLSCDHSPENERKRLQFLAYRSPELLSNSFSRLEYSRVLCRKDVKKKVLYRDWFMDGWAAKTVRDSDLRPPLVSDGPRKRRLLNTIGVTRGFGDHHLMTLDDKIPIKPFLSPVPEVRVFDLNNLNTLTDRDVMIIASDGLWDVLSNEDVANIVQSALGQQDTDERTKYTLAAQDLVIAARGNPTGTGRWQLQNSKGSASTDDITVFVIPLKYALAPPTFDEDDDVELLQ